MLSLHAIPPAPPPFLAGTSLAQAEGLMASAVKQQKGLNLSVGVALSASQVSALTQSLVWWVSAKVNGRTVLVPVVYLAKNDQKSITNGALIAGTNVVANVAGNITNSGTISGANLVSLTAGNDFINMAGGLVTGGTVGITAGNDILNQAGAAITGGDIFLTAGRDIMMSSTIDTSTSTSRESLGGKRFTSETITSQVATGSTIAATGNLVMNAGRDISISFGNVSAGGDAAMIAGRDVLITGVTTTDTQDAAWKTGKYRHGTSSSSEETFHGSVIKVGGDLGISAGRDIGIIGSTIKVGDDLSMQAGGGITIAAAETHSSESLDERLSKKIRTNQIDATATTHVLADISAGGNIGISTPGAFTVAGATIAAGDPSTGSGGALLAINAGSVSITGVMDEVTQDTKRVVKSGGMLSSKKTTTVTSMVDQSVIGSTLEGDRVSITSLGDPSTGSGGTVSIKGSNVVATGNLAINAGGMIDIGTMVEEDSSFSSVKVKKSGLSFSGTSMFVGVQKNTNTDEATSLINRGSLVGSATGNVTLNADGAVNIIGSKVVSPGVTTIIGDSVTIANATDVVTGVQTSKSSSFGVTATISSPLISSLQALGNMAQIAAGADSGRTAAVAGLAGGLAAANAVHAIKDLGGLTDLAKDPMSVLNVSVTAGFSKSSSRTDTTDQTVVGSVVSGGDVNIVARGNGGGEGSGTINIVGSTIDAQRDLMIAATKAITVEAAQETDTTKSKNKSSGFSVGVAFGPNGPSPTASVNVGKGSSSGTDVTNIESQLIAGGTATIVTPDAFILRGGTLEADTVRVNAGSLVIESLQDKSDFASRQTSIGISASLDLGAAGAKPTGSVGGSFSQTREKGSFASVAEQSGIFAGAGGFDIRVDGVTTLTGGVIDSDADASRNRLATQTLVATDIINREKYSGSQIGFSGSLSDIGAGKGAEGGSTTVPGKDGNPAPGAGSDGSRVPGIHTPIGTIAAGAPVVLGASGGQTGTTHSAIAPGAIIILPGADGIRDAASQAIANVISRDTAAANDGAITQEFDEAKRAEIAKGFEAAQTLVEQTTVFFNNRASEQRKEEKKLEALGSRDANGEWQPNAGLTTEQLKAFNEAKVKYTDLQKNFGAGSPARIIATALTGAAGGNVAGNLTGLVQGVAVNVLQSLAVNQVKHIADSLYDADGNPTAGSEAVRAALQGLTACVGGAANGSGSCGGAAAGASASVVINYLLTEFLDPQLKDAQGNPIERTLEDQQARTNLVATLIGAIAAGAGLDAGSAVTAVQIEMENNTLNDRVVKTREVPFTIQGLVDAGYSNVQSALDAAKEPGEDNEDVIARYEEYIECAASTARDCKPDPKMAALASAFGAAADQEKIRTEKLAYQADVEFLKSIGIEVGSNNGGTQMTPAQVRELAAERRADQQQIGGQLARLQQIESDYDAQHGYGAYRKMLAAEAAQAQANNDQATAAARRAQLELLCAGLACPALAAGSVVFLPGAINATTGLITGSLGLSAEAAIATKVVVSGTFNWGTTVGSSWAVNGEGPSAGQQIGSFLIGGLFAPGLVGVGRFPEPVNGLINGGLSTGAANVVGQFIDIIRDSDLDFNNFDAVELRDSVLAGGFAGFLGGTVAPLFGRTPNIGNSQSILAGIRHGWRELMNTAPAIVVTTVTQTQLDLLFTTIREATSPNNPRCSDNEECRR